MPDLVVLLSVLNCSGSLVVGLVSVLVGLQTSQYGVEHVSD